VVTRARFLTCAGLSGGDYSRRKSFLVLFFKKERFTFLERAA
jgi:hypothetical protein